MNDVVAGIRESVRTNPRFGYRRIAALLRQEGISAKGKRVSHLGHRDGLKVPGRVKKMRRLETACGIGRSVGLTSGAGISFPIGRRAAGL